MANPLTKIPKFRRCVLQNFPFIEQDFDALTDYQLLCKVVEYLNKVITSQNAVIDVAESLTTAFNELQSFVANYFANLDVQEEINNKLDQMAEDGTLQEIITAYIQANVAWTFDTVADMKAATNLVDGSYARTLGFHTINDGGGALYRISNTGTANEMDIIAIDTLYAILVGNKEYTAKQFGAYGDNTHDDTAYLQQAIDYVSAKKGKLTLTEGTYLVNAVTNLFMKSDITLDFVDAKIKATPNDQTTYNVIYMLDCQNCVINNAVIEGEKDEHEGDEGEFGYGVNIRGESKNIIFNNLTVSNCWGDGVFLNRNRIGSTDYRPNGIYFNGYTRISDCRRQGVSIISAENVYFDKLICKNIYGTDPSAGVDIEPNNSADIVGRVNINYLETDGTLKGFTMRMRSELIGDVTIGEINHHNQRTRSEGIAGRYEQAFRVMFEYFKTGQSAVKVSVDKVYSEHNSIQLENLYNDVTPQVIIGDVLIGDYQFISSATPTLPHRSLVNIRYTQTTNLSNSLGGLIIGNVIYKSIGNLTGTTINNMSPFTVNYEGETSLSSLVFENTRIGNIDAITKTDDLNWDNNSTRSNVLCNNIDIKCKNIKDVYNRRNSGTFTCITSGGNTIYLLPLSDATSNKYIQLRPRNSLQPFTLKCVGNSTVTINTAHQITYFTKVYLNDAELTGVDGIYSIGTFADGAEFKIWSEGSSIYVQQIS